MKLYRVVSSAERDDFDLYGSFRTARNTMEATQFFKTEFGVQEFYRSSLTQDYQPPYSSIIVVDINEACLEVVDHDVQVLDGFDAITVSEDCSPDFNEGINFTTLNDLEIHIHING